ncbi:MAG: hypothetical protein ACJ8DI_31195 [Ktedonobacteraceae bacterium]
MIVPGHGPAKDEASLPGINGSSWQRDGKLLGNELAKLLVGERKPPPLSGLA